MALTKVDLANVVTGVLPVANGGTGTSTGVAPGGSDRQVQFNNAGAFGGNSGLVYDSSGNLGLGVTPSAWSISPAMQVSRAALYGSSSQTILANNWYYGSGDKYIGNGYATLYQQVNGQHQWQTAASGTAGNAITFTQAMTLDASGRLGIGTTSPSEKLDVSGSGNVYAAVRSSSSNAGVLLQNPYATYYMLVGGSTFSVYDNGAAATRFAIDSTGNVGIGTSSPNDTLEVAGTNAFIRVNRTGNEPGITFRYSNSTTNRGDIAVTSGGDMYFTAGGSTERARITSAGLMQFNSGYGSVATAYGCRVWVNFNGQGTIAIRGSGGVSSLTDNGTVNYTVNFSITLPDTNYATAVTNDHDSGSGSNQQMFVLTSSNTSYANKSTTALQVRGYNTTSADFDPYGVNVMVFR